MDVLNLPPWLDNAIGIITTVPFIYWYVRKWMLLHRMRQDSMAATAQVLRKIGNTILYQYADSEGRAHRQRLKLDKGAALLLPGETLDVLYAKNKPGFSCPAGELEASLRKNRMAFFSFTGFTLLCFVLPFLA